MVEDIKDFFYYLINNEDFFNIEPMRVFMDKKFSEKNVSNTLK